jgi:hypothetical protein
MRAAEESLAMKMDPIWYKETSPKLREEIERKQAEYRRQEELRAQRRRLYFGAIEVPFAVVLHIASWIFGFWILYVLFRWLFG